MIVRRMRKYVNDFRLRWKRIDLKHVVGLLLGSPTPSMPEKASDTGTTGERSLLESSRDGDVTSKKIGRISLSSK